MYIDVRVVKQYQAEGRARAARIRAARRHTARPNRAIHPGRLRTAVRLRTA